MNAAVDAPVGLQNRAADRNRGACQLCGHLTVGQADRLAGAVASHGCLAHAHERIGARPVNRRGRRFRLPRLASVPLSPDQTALLELLLAGQSYSELAELFELERDDVQRRAREALAELGGADPDRNVGLTDYLLGQADPIGRADAARHLRQDAADHALAGVIAERLGGLSPAAELPNLPPAPGGGRFMGTKSPGPSVRETRSPLARVSKGRSRMYVGLGATALVVVAIALGVAGVFSGDDDAASSGASPSSSDEPTAEDQQDSSTGLAGIPDGEELSRVPLTPVGSGDATGAAIVGLSTGDQAYLDVIVRKLDPAPEGKAYVVWFMFDQETGYPLSPIFPENDGSFQDRFAIPTAVTGLVASTQFIEISLSNARQTLKEIQAAAQAETYQITRPGSTVLRGRVPSEPSAASEEG